MNAEIDVKDPTLAALANQTPDLNPDPTPAHPLLQDPIPDQCLNPITLEDLKGK